MLNLVDKILEKIPYDTITDTELAVLLDGSQASRYNQVKRALANGELIHIRRGVYALAKRYQRQPINPFALAQKVYGPSYISLESALSYHGLIPEGVYTVSSACLKRSREFKTPLGVYSFTQIPQRAFSSGVDRIEIGREVFLLATPIKALTDYVFSRHPDFQNIELFLESLRIEMTDLKLDNEEIQSLSASFESPRITRFLSALKKAAKL